MRVSATATATAEDLERFERLHGVQVAREILREAFGLELVVLGDEGPTAHVRGGVMTSSSEVCRAALFTRAGFARCDAFYRELAKVEGEHEATCHLGLAAVCVPASLESETVAWLAASGFLAPDRAGTTPLPAARIVELLREIDPNLPDPAAPVRSLRIVRGDRIDVVRAILRAAAREIAAHVRAGRRRRAGSAEGAGQDVAGLWGIVGASSRMQAVFELLERVVESHASVLIRGESGTGKELVARALHEHGPRHARRFVAQNCAAMPEDLLETTLFGHVRGAFSGAVRATGGLFGAADKGTLFLDEVGDMSPAMQVKLLRVLQDGRYTPVGGTEPREVDVRVVAASHRDLGAMVARGEFRQDLFYRLHVLTIDLPPLRDRPGDLRLLVPALARGGPVDGRPVGDAAWSCLERYAWPGNVRELAAEVERWGVTSQGAAEIGPEHLSAAVRDAGGYSGARDGEAAAKAAAGDGTLGEAVGALERALIVRGLERTGGNRARLARELGISRTTLAEKLKRYGLA